MKKVNLLFFIFYFGLTIAQTPSEKSVLWKIEGQGLTKPSYLFGTIHIMCSSEFKINEKVITAFEKTDKLVLEINTEEPTEMAEMQKMMLSDKTISSQLNEEEQKNFNVILSKNFGVTLQQIDQMNPATLSMLLAFKSIPCAPTEIKSFENELMARAKSSNRSIDALEKVADQAAALQNAYPLKEIISQMALQPEYELLFTEWRKLYNEENLPQLHTSLLDERFLNKNAKQSMMSDRNVKWAEKMPVLMQKESIFFTVGAAHLSGEDGVINLLKKKGYKVTPVYK